MKVILSAIAIFTVIAISGCESLYELKAKHDLAMINEAKKSCVEYGFVEGTDSFANCVQKEINENRNRETLENSSK